jgi:DNA primase
MRGIDFAAARAGVRIAEVLELIDYEPRRVMGEQARGGCPLHRSRSSRSRVFAVHLGKNVYHCFGCGAGGNALDLWAAWTRQSLHAAVVDLYQRLGREVPWLPYSSSRSAWQSAPAPSGSTHEEAKTMSDP